MAEQPNEIDVMAARQAWETVAPFPHSTVWSGSYSEFDKQRELIELSRYVASRNFDLGHFTRICAEGMGIAIGNALAAGFITEDEAEREVEATAEKMRQLAGLGSRNR